MDDLARAGSISATVAAKSASPAVATFHREMSKNVMKPVFSGLTMANQDLKGTPSAQDLELAMFVKPELRGIIQTIPVGRYEPSDTLKPDRRAWK